ncbi:MAG: energy-coupling factor transporter transmembrane component T [Ignisphaera sp.]|nr:energy-coupling factor transporter transmembrane protein EcfT [Ignisphaera sp.]MDW8084781.1 energy-coupling factor transporter transmembrane component T [Ignisphaera sp.]
MKWSFFDAMSYALLYEELSSPLHLLDPRAKLLYVVLTIAVSVAVSRLDALLLVLAVNLAVLALYRNLIARFILLLRGLAPFIAIIVVFNILVSLAFTSVSIAETVATQLRSVTRIACLTAALLVLLSTTTPRQIIQAFTSIGITYTYVYPFIVALRFIPILFSEMRNIYDAQRARGLDFERGRAIDRVKRLTAIVIPTIVCSVIRAKDLIEAMELRGFGYSKKRTFYKPIKFRRVDVIFTVAITAVYLAAIIAAVTTPAIL